MKYNQIGRAVIRLYYHARTFPVSLETVVLGTTIKAGRYMDFAERIRRRGSELSHRQITTYARLVGVDESELRLAVLPMLEQAKVLDYTITNGQISIDEYVGVSAPLLKQIALTWEALGPSVTERCALESIELATAAPLYENDHYAALEVMGFSDETRTEALKALQAIGMIRYMQLPEGLVIYNEYVWGHGIVPIARFLATFHYRNSTISTLA